MIVTVVTVYVKPENVADFIAATIKNHEGSIKEPGNMRFDVLQCTDDQMRFTLYEAYESKEAVAAHKQTEHYLAWRKMVEPWMAKPREGVVHSVIRPEGRGLW
ncbi:MAG: antibiotic biosynthesis monooxygenase [Candidatus Magnetoovum sp. WYHC-5]|nr:antibiotic biosynthesis monooxygenase [Candidatus Magnetoovum sp. WYHC-5]